MSDEFLAGIEQEGLKVDLSNLGEQEKETSEGSPAEPNQTESTPSSDGAQVQPDNNPKEKNIPFDKHPRWIEREKEWSERLNQYESRLKAFESSQPQSQPAKPDIPQPFVELFGENPEAWEKWQALSNLQRETIEREMASKQEQEQKAKVEEQTRWDTWREQSIAKIEAEKGISLPEGSSERNELLKIAVDYMPTDEEGNISFSKAYDLMTKLHKDESDQKSKVRKSIAAATAPETKAESEQPTYYTPADFKRFGKRF